MRTHAEALAYQREYYAKNREKSIEYQKQYRERNKEILKAKAKAKYVRKTPLLSPEERKERDYARARAYYHENREARLIKQKEWASQNRSRLAAYKLEYDRKNPNRLLMRSFRHLPKIVKNFRITESNAKCVLVLGISLNQFRAYISSKFEPGMTWENHGEWHLDHKVSLSKFDLSNPEEYAKAGHYTNYQPLWALDNIRKR